jgi:hypothetical protein
VGIDHESKGYQIYWPTHRKVSVEQDVYVDRSKVFEPETVQIEGEKAAEKVFNPPISDSHTPEPAENKLPQNTPTSPINETISSPTSSKIPFPHEQEALSDKPNKSPVLR